MSGYLIFMENLVLNRYGTWDDDEYGWIWTEEEKNSILEESKRWGNKPTHMYKAILLANKTTKTGDKIILL